MSNRLLLTGFAAAFAVLIGIVAGMFFLRQGQVELNSGTLLPTPRPIADFALTGSDGKPFTRAALEGHWSLLYAGYTFCPDVCPTTLTDLKSVLAKMGPDAAKLKVVFISVDPARDTPAKLDQYVHYFSPDFEAATGDTAVLEKLGLNIGFVFTKVPGATEQSYLMDHSASLILVDPNAGVAGYFSPPFQSEVMAADLKKVVERNS